jgi:gluconolactonase
LLVSPDGKTLYVGDDELDDWRSYPIGDDGTVGSGKVFFKPDLPNKTLSDGMTMDAEGNLYFTGQCNFPDGKGGVWVVSPEGKALGRIATPTFCSYAVIGGPDGKTLYLTCDKHVYSLKLNVGPANFAGE